MPTEHTVTSYKFEELSDKAKEVARDWFREGGLDYEWWDSTYLDAANIGLKITGFDLGRGIRRVDGKLTRPAAEVARAVLKEHGKACDTYALAEAFLDSLKDEEDPAHDEQCERFVYDLRAAYWSILYAEQEYLTSDEQVDETIKANEYDFLANGRRFTF